MRINYSLQLRLKAVQRLDSSHPKDLHDLVNLLHLPENTSLEQRLLQIAMG